MVQYTKLCVLLLGTSNLVASLWWPFKDIPLPDLPGLLLSYSEAPHSTTSSSVKSGGGSPTSSSGSASSRIESSASSFVTIGSSSIVSTTQPGSSIGSTPTAPSSPVAVSSTPTDSVISVSGCPPITVTTTVIATNWPTSYTSTFTYHYPPYEYFYTTGTFVSTSTLYGTQVTVYTSTTTRTSIVVSSPTTTVTVPTSPGFTPILCEPIYYAKTSTTTWGTYTTAATTAITDDTLPVTTLTSYTVTYNATVTTSVATGTVSAVLTSTVTETRPDLTKTVYDACATNNLGTRAPDGGYFFYTGGTGLAKVTALDPIDCCELCQANSSCVSSTFINKDAFTGLPYEGLNCALWASRNTDPTTIAPSVCNATAYGPVTGGGVVSNFDGPFDTLSNSGCGQFELTY